MSDPYNLQRFVDAQEPVIGEVLAELRNGRKLTHWMWFVFPQVTGLGQSATARHFSIADINEADAYLAHPVLGERLRACCKLLLALAGNSPEEVFGSIDAIKLRSSMTLFLQASGDLKFSEVLNKYYNGEADAATLQILENIQG